MLKKPSGEAGFSYIDVIIAIMILMIGILAMISALTANLIRSFESEKRIVAKQLALSTLESIVSTKEMKIVGLANRDNWDRIQNVQNLPPPQIDGIFLSGFNPVRRDNGPDGIAGTIDDACPPPGACGSNTSPILDKFQRRIVITDVNDPERPFPAWKINIRRVDVTIRYYSNQLIRDETISTMLTFYEK